MTVLLDNPVLSKFSTVRRPDLDGAAFVENVGTTEQTFQETQEGVAAGQIPACDWDWLARVARTPVEQAQFETICEHMGEGEASCLAVARERGTRLATDDKEARRLARELGIARTRQASRVQAQWASWLSW